jgi:predicted ester cyclase
MLSRRTLLTRTFGAGLALSAAHPARLAAQSPAADLERNKEVVRRLKESQGTKDEAAVQRELTAPGSKRLRAGIEHLARNAQDQDFPNPGPNLRTAFPDRTDVIESMIAEGDRVGMIFRVSGTHQGNFLGIPPTGKKFEFLEMAMFRLADGKVTESWFMADEAGLMRQLGAKMPPRRDGKTLAPPLSNAGEDPDVVLKRLQAGPLATIEDRNRLLIARSKASTPLPKSEQAADFKQTRVGFQHLRDYGDRKGVPSQNITDAMPDRHDRIEDFIAEGENVWMRFRLAAVHSKPLYGLPPAGKHVDVTEIGVMRVVEGKWKQAWYFGDELGLLLQLGFVDALQA